MSEKQAFPKFDFKLLEGYTPYDGDGWPDLITNGVYAVKIASAHPDTAKQSGNAKIKGTLVVQDDDHKGAKLIFDKPYTGVRTDGKPNLAAFGDIFMSGRGLEWVGKSTAMGEVDVEKVITMITKPEFTYYVEVRAKTAPDKDGVEHTFSEVKNFIDKEKYLAAVESNTHRQAGTAPVKAPSSGGIKDVPANGATARKAAPGKAAVEDLLA